MKFGLPYVNIKPYTMTEEHEELAQVVLDEVFSEMTRQVDKFGLQLHDPATWLSIETEELGEAAKALNDGDYKNFKTEVLQVAAVAVSILVSLEQQEQLQGE